MTFPAAYRRNIDEALKIAGAMGALGRWDQWAVYYYAFRITLLTLQRRRMTDRSGATDDDARRSAELAFWNVIAREVGSLGTRGLVLVPNNDALEFVRTKITELARWKVRTYTKSNARLEFTNGSTVVFRFQQNGVDHVRGLELDWAWLPYPADVDESGATWLPTLRPAFYLRRGRFYVQNICLFDASQDRTNGGDPRRG